MTKNDAIGKVKYLRVKLAEAVEKRDRQAAESADIIEKTNAEISQLEQFIEGGD